MLNALKNNFTSTLMSSHPVKFDIRAHKYASEKSRVELEPLSTFDRSDILTLGSATPKQLLDMITSCLKHANKGCDASVVNRVSEFHRFLKRALDLQELRSFDMAAYVKYHKAYLAFVECELTASSLAMGCTFPIGACIVSCVDDAIDVDAACVTDIDDEVHQDDIERPGGPYWKGDSSV